MIIKCKNIKCNAYIEVGMTEDVHDSSCYMIHIKPIESCGNYIPANVVNIGGKDDRADTCSVGDMLHNGLQGITQEPRWSKKAALLLLDNEDGYHVRTMCAGFSQHSEIISLLQLTLIEQASLMGFPSK